MSASLFFPHAISSPARSGPCLEQEADFDDSPPVDRALTGTALFGNIGSRNMGAQMHQLSAPLATEALNRGKVPPFASNHNSYKGKSAK